LSNNKSKAKARSIPNGPGGKTSTPTTAQVQTSGAATLVRSAASAAIVLAVQHADPHNGSLATTNRNDFVREVPTLIYVRAVFHFLSVAFGLFLVVRFDSGPSFVDRL
jgi:hypothetical protein